jgi:hypothetical protein
MMSNVTEFVDVYTHFLRVSPYKGPQSTACTWDHNLQRASTYQILKSYVYSLPLSSFFFLLTFCFFLFSVLLLEPKLAKA